MIMEHIIPNFVKNAPDTILLLATNSGDMLTHVHCIQVIRFSSGRIFAGILLDSARLRYNLGQYLGVASTSVNAFIVGEHGNN